MDVAETGQFDVLIADEGLDFPIAWRGTSLVLVDRWFPSSKLCSACGVKNVAPALTERT